MSNLPRPRRPNGVRPTIPPVTPGPVPALPALLGRAEAGAGEPAAQAGAGNGGTAAAVQSAAATPAAVTAAPAQTAAVGDRCPQCGSGITADQLSCATCGRVLRAAPAPVAEARRVRRGEIFAVVPFTIQNRAPVGLMLLLGALRPLLALALTLGAIALIWIFVLPYLGKLLGGAALILLIAFILIAMAGGSSGGATDVLGGAARALFGGILRMAMGLFQGLNRFFSGQFGELNSSMRMANRQINAWTIHCKEESGENFAVQITGDIVSGGVPVVSQILEVTGPVGNPARIVNVSTGNEIVWRRRRVGR